MAPVGHGYDAGRAGNVTGGRKNLGGYARAASAVEDVVLKCLRRPREERYDSMTALASALRAAGA
jgi:hypothetical protein